MARSIVLIPHLFRLANVIKFRKDYSPPSPPSQPFNAPVALQGQPLACVRCIMTAKRPAFSPPKAENMVARPWHVHGGKHASVVSRAHHGGGVDRMVVW